MNFTYDTAKDEQNRAKHGLSLAQASELEWNSALVWIDARFNYEEKRECALALLDDRLYFCAFVDRGDARRIISLRKANNREKDFYVTVSKD